MVVLVILMSWFIYFDTFTLYLSVSLSTVASRHSQEQLQNQQSSKLWMENVERKLPDSFVCCVFPKKKKNINCKTCLNLCVPTRILNILLFVHPTGWLVGGIVCRSPSSAIRQARLVGFVGWLVWWLLGWWLYVR